MVILQTTNDIQVNKTKPRNEWFCIGCRRTIPKGATRYTWRLRYPFGIPRAKSNMDGWDSAMFWTNQCYPCFKFTVASWSKTLAKM